MVEVIIRIVSGIGTDDVSPLYDDLKGSSRKMASAFAKLDPETRGRALKMFAGLLSTEAGYAVRQAPGRRIRNVRTQIARKTLRYFFAR